MNLRDVSLGVSIAMLAVGGGMFGATLLDESDHTPPPFRCCCPTATPTPSAPPTTVPTPTVIPTRPPLATPPPATPPPPPLTTPPPPPTTPTPPGA